MVMKRSNALSATPGGYETMKVASSKVFKQALGLGERDRATLAGLLIESLEREEPGQDLEAAWKVEIQRRIKELDSGDVKTIPWDEVKSSLFQRGNRG
jgi:putative addiction module component (TIGR02574 family)